MTNDICSKGFWSPKAKADEKSKKGTVKKTVKNHQLGINNLINGLEVIILLLFYYQKEVFFLAIYCIIFVNVKSFMK